MSEALTPRELEVLRLLCAGLMNKQIAAALDVDLKTVEAHRARLMRVSRCRTACQLGVWAERNGLAPEPVQSRTKTNTTRAAVEAHSSDRVSPITKAAALPSAKGTPREA